MWLCFSGPDFKAIAKSLVQRLCSCNEVYASQVTTQKLFISSSELARTFSQHKAVRRIKAHIIGNQTLCPKFTTHMEMWTFCTHIEAV